MTVQNRKTARASLLAALETITAFAEVYDYLPKDLSGLSPVCTIESGPADYAWLPSDQNMFKFIVGVWVRRDDAEDAEDLLDDLSYAVAGVIQDWHSATFYQESDPGYDLIDQVYYRSEAHFVSVEWE